MHDQFSKEKSDFLNKKDKSKKGCIDEGIIKVINKINSKKDYYTTSSCSGRILLIERRSKKKNESGWIFSKHAQVNVNEILKALNEYSIIGKSNKKINNKNDYEVWFKQQPFILHVACRNIDAAKKFLDAARKILKRSGIISITKHRVMIEVIGTNRMEAIIADNNFIIDKNYLKNLIKYGNRNFIENKKKIRRFWKVVKKI